VVIVEGEGAVLGVNLGHPVCCVVVLKFMQRLSCCLGCEWGQSQHGCSRWGPHAPSGRGGFGVWHPHSPH